MQRLAATLFSVAALIAPAIAHAADYKVVDRIKVPDGGFDYAVFDANRSRVYMARPDYTTVVDAKTHAVSQLSSASGGHMLLAIPGSSLGLLPQRNGAIRLVDIVTDMVVADFPTGGDPDAAVYDPLTKLVFVVNKGTGDTSVVDPFKRKVVETIPVGGTLQFPASDGRGHVFVNSESAPEIAVIDVRSLKVTGRYKLDGCTGASGLAYDAEARLLISGCLNGMVKVLDAATGREVASLPIGSGPDATFYDAERHVALIPCGGDGVLEVISLADPKHISVVQHVPTQQGSRTGTVDPQTGLVYLMASMPDTSKPAPKGGRIPRLAGSFEVLVVSPGP
jgi:DNA-binding beta-propeller fold protein YncE